MTTKKIAAIFILTLTLFVATDSTFAKGWGRKKGGGGMGMAKILTGSPEPLQRPALSRMLTALVLRATISCRIRETR